MIPGIVSTQLARDSSTLLAGGGRAKAADYARAAVSAEPWSASAHAQLALSERAAHDLTAARADAQRAVDLEPLDWTNHLLLATIDSQRGLAKAGLGQLRAAARLDSKDPRAVTRSTLRRASRPSRIAGLAP
jgi:tetratricopeptide (TPR) repeat protein